MQDFNSKPQLAGARMTKKELAAACGVSRMTLDRVLRGLPGVSEQKRQQIQAVLNQHGYRTNTLARSLVSGRSHSFGVVVFDLANPFYAQFVNAFQLTAQQGGYVSYIMLSNKNQKLEKAHVEALLSRQVEGIVLNSAVAEENYGAYLKELHIPVLSVMNRIDDIPFLGFDEAASAEKLTRLAVNRGYRHLFFVCPPLARAATSNMDSLVRRKQGFLRVMAEHPELRYTLLETKDYLEILQSSPFFVSERCCVICTSDIYALEIRGRFLEAGLEAPRDYGIAGYDNIPLLQAYCPYLTTVSLNIQALGEAAASMLLSSTENVPLAVSRVMPYTLLDMGSI